MALPHLYSRLAEWWPLLSPPEHYEEEASLYLSLLAQARGGAPGSLLELGSGAGHLASHLPAEMDVALVDLSPEMLALSQQTNPSHTHHLADMRSLSLGRTFDAVLLHDAVMYLTDRDSLRQALQVVYDHCAPGGAALLLPDVVAETFTEFTTTGGQADAEGRALQLLEWHWDPDPSDETYQVEFALMLRDADGTVRVEHDQHTMALYPRALYWKLLREIGFEPVAADFIFDAPMGEVFLMRRPG